MLAICAAAAAAGIATHILYFNKGEHHMYGVAYIQALFGSCLAAVVSLINLQDYALYAAIGTTATIALSYLTGIWASVLIYRIFLCPWAKFPGPWQASISGFWLFGHLNMEDAPYQHEALHKKYGKYVRIGPDTLSITDADVHEAAFGHNTKFRKSVWYDGSKPFSSMHTTRDRAVHDRRRRTWAPAFSDKALREYEPKVRAHNHELLEQIRKRENQPIDISLWFNLYAFDVMGQLAFGKDYEMVKNGKRHWALDLLTEGMSTVGPRPPMWFFRILTAIPFAAGGMFKFLKFCKDELEWRINNKNAEGDITGWLLKAYPSDSKPAEDPMFNGDSRLIIVAGSDTTSATLTYLFYNLAKKPEEIKKIRDELRPLAQGDWTDINIRDCKHLNGATNEALRLHPPVPSGLERKVPEGGATVNGTYLPGETIFWMPQYVIGRDEDYYEKATDFIPERWYSRPEMIKHKNAFAAFSLGSEGCIGKNLAYVEMRTVSALLLLNYDVSFAEGEDGTRLLTTTKDHFTLGVGKLDLVFTPVAS